ncbi:hypothetical protein OS493_028914 [Desmophyllum pertusum]|uniref:F-box domain-containing protein n=1 Tax=Desmophyllum pertusum TaxID=174260 RepID=A0A9X0CVE1_9CNID|nr:hypothetical protein OS493_028914 [Desmophyllum pertusum]
MADSAEWTILNILQRRRPVHVKTTIPNDLPEECLVHVLENLQFHEICNIARVCKRFYQVSWNPTLWKSIDLSSVYAFPISGNLVYLSQMMTFPKRRMLLALFLSARRAALTDIHGDIDIYREAGMFLCLLINCNVRNLQTVKLRLPFGTNYHTYMPSGQELQTFQDVLRCLVQKCSNVLKSLKCYVDISYTTAKLLGSLHSLEYLNLQYVSPSWRSDLPYLHPKSIDAILSLPNLKYLKMSISQFISENKYFPGYVLQSDSLEELDFGFTKQFIIKKLLFPKLHTLKAESPHKIFHMSDSKRVAVCLFDVVERGCPLIQTLNDYTSLVPGLQNFNLSDIQKRDLYFCNCSLHAPSRFNH